MNASILESKKIGPFNLRNEVNKEWWYTGCYDPSKNIYFSFCIVCTPFFDYVSLSLFDPANKIPIKFSKRIRLNNKEQTEALYMSYNSKDMKFSYIANETNGLDFYFETNDIKVNLNFIKTTAPVVKIDDLAKSKYYLLQYFHNIVKGEVQFGRKVYSINNGLGILDRYFGRIPRNIFWNWLAVQNESIAFTGYVSICSQPNKYSHCYLKTGEHKDKWISLSHDLSFQYYNESHLNDTWNLISPDVELEITMCMGAFEHSKIPQLMPFIVNIKHYEFFVKAKGRIKIENTWIDVNNLNGVFERHYGIW